LSRLSISCTFDQKHGRTGFPKKKTLTFDEATNALLWTGADTDKPSGLAFFTAKKTDTEKSRIPLDTITEVRRGIQTEVLLKAKGVDPNCCLSIITTDRSLDLTLSNATDRDELLTGLKGVLEAKKTVKFR
jgi:hypothetical protein